MTVGLRSYQFVGKLKHRMTMRQTVAGKDGADLSSVNEDAAVADGAIRGSRASQFSERDDDDDGASSDADEVRSTRDQQSIHSRVDSTIEEED